MTSFLPDELYITNIPGDANEAEMVRLLEQFGKVKEYVVVSKRREANLSQAALVRMESHAGALAVKKALNRVDFKTKQLHIRWSHTQRVIWASNLHESVTNEVLRAAFSQFGNIERALVVADAQTLATKCYGFVVFENKKDAGRAVAKCVESPFMIGLSNKPVKVDWAKLEDTDQGFSEELRTGNKGAAAALDLDSKTVSRFAAPGTREYLLAVRMAEVHVEYDQLKQAMRGRLMELQEQLLATGHAPSLATCLANDPAFAAVRAAGAPPPLFAPPPMQAPLGMGQQPPPGQYGPPGQFAPPTAALYGPPPAQYGPPPDLYGGGLVPMKRDTMEFHHVPPPKRSAMRAKDPDFERFNPEASARAHHPEGHQAPANPSAPPPAPGPAPTPAPTVHKLPPVGSGLSFVKGGQLHTSSATVAVEPPKSGPSAVAAAPQPGAEGAEGEAPAVAPPGAKAPGKQHDFRGIGFTGSVPPPAPAAPAQHSMPHMPQQYAPYQVPQQQQQQYAQAYAAAAAAAAAAAPPPPGGAAPMYNPYAAQQPVPAGQQYSYPPPQQQQQQQAPAPQQQFQQQAPTYATVPPQYGAQQQQQQYGPPGQFGPPAQFAAPPAPAADAAPPAMSGYSVGGQQQAYTGQYAQQSYF